jgi:hypothetical protein
MTSVDPSKIIRIVAQDLPEFEEPGEGDYVVRFGDRPDTPELHDVITLRAFLKDLWPDRVADIIDRLQNFRRVYLNLATGEITGA